MQPFDYARPETFEEASALLARAQDGGGCKVCILAGGTELLPRLEAGVLTPILVVDIKRLPGLSELWFDPIHGLTIGAAVTLRRLGTHPDVRRLYGLFLDVYEVMGVPQVRNRGTVGGNLCNASPAADTAPALLCYDAVCRISGPEGERSVPLEEFLIGPKQTALGPGDLLVSLHLPPPTGRAAGVYQKLRMAKGGHLGLVNAAVLAQIGDESGANWRIALGAVGPRPFRAHKAEAALQHGRGAPDAATIRTAAALAQEAAEPIDDLRATAAYRRAMVTVLVRRGIETTVARLAGASA